MRFVMLTFVGPEHTERWKAWSVDEKRADPLRRLHTLASATWNAEIPEDLVAFVVAGDLDDRTVLGPGWRTPGLVEGEARLRWLSPFPGARTRCSDGSTGLEPENTSETDALSSVGVSPFARAGAS